MVSSTKKYWAIFQAQVINNFAYPADLFSRSFTIVIFMWVFTQLWRTTFNAMGQEVISGLTLNQTLWYLVIAETIVLSKPRLSTGIAQAVKDGSVAYLLNKPYNFLLYQASVGLGNSVLQIVINFVIGGTVIWLMAGPPPAPGGLPLVVVAILLGWLLDFCLSAMIGLAAFVTEDVTAFEWIYQKVLFILGGLLIPLDFYPGWLRSIALSMPFAYSVYGPARLFVAPSLNNFALLLAGQLAWLAVLGLVLTLLYRRGVSWLTINGG